MPSIFNRDRLVGLTAKVAMGVLVAGAAACSSDDNTTTPPLKATTVTVVSGNTQTGAVATAATSPLIVQVKDQNGNPMSGVVVTFAATNGASLSAATATTDAAGNATTNVTFGQLAGTDSVTATVSGVSQPVAFTFTANPGAAAALVQVSGNNQTMAAGGTLANALTVKVTDQYGNAVPGATVDWTTTGGVLVGSAQATSDANGTASDVLQLPATPGTTTVTATLHGTSTTSTFTETGS